MLKQHIWLLDKCEVPLRISVQHERAVLIGPSKGRSLSSAIGRPFESRRWIGCALADPLSIGHPTAELCYVGHRTEPITDGFRFVVENPFVVGICHGIVTAA